MKLLSVYISSFGNLKDFSFDFNDGITTINEQNGWGKSTLATFIKCMFYGLNDSKKSVKDNERIKFRPWNTSELFGGNVRFSWGNKCYKLERFFGTKESEDSSKLIDEETGKEYTKLDSLTNKIFELDEEGFLSTTYLSQKDFEIKNNTSLTNKFNSNGGDEDIFNRALDIVSEREKQYKSRGDKGLISDINASIYKIEGDIDRCLEAEKTVNTLKNELSFYENKSIEIKDLSDNLYKKITQSNREESILLKKKNLADAESEKEALIYEKKELCALLKDKTITNEIVVDLEKKIAEAESIKKQQESEKIIAKEKKEENINILFLFPVLLFIVGILSLFLLNTIVGAIITASSIGSLIAILLFKVVNKRKDIEKKEQEKNNLDSLYNEKINVLNNFFSQFNLSNVSYDLALEKLKQWQIKIDELGEKIGRVEEKINILKKDEDISKNVEKIDIKYVENQYNNSIKEFKNCSEKIVEIRQKIAINEEFSSQYLYKLEEKSNLIEKLDNYKRNYNTLCLTERYLKMANDTYKTKMRSPLQCRLDYYSNLLFNGDYKLNIDIDLKLTIERFGKSFNKDYFSKGQNTIFSICERFALIDVLFEREKPFIILDDPFCDLDNEKLFEAKNIIKLLSKDYQIIYFTCHDSRLLGA